MRFAPVSPASCLRHLPPTGYHLVLSNLAFRDPAVRGFYATRIQQGDFVILDNPVHERVAGPSLEQLVALAAALRPSAVTILDVIGDPGKTLTNFHQFAPFFKKVPGVEPMGVVQGKNVNEYMECIYSLAPHCRFIGIPLIRKFEQIDRAKFVWKLTAQGFFGAFPGVHIHLLGADQTMSDAFQLRNHPRVMGIDSAKPVYLGLKGIGIKQATEGDWGRPEGFFETSEEEANLRADLVCANVSAIRDQLSSWRQAGNLQSSAKLVAS